MNTDSAEQTVLVPIVIDDDIVVQDLANVSDSTAEEHLVKYDDTKLASTCLAQFFGNYNITTKSASCLICSSIVKKSGDSTFNFVRHVKRHHLDAHKQWVKRLVEKEEALKSKQPSIKSALVSPRGTKYASGHPRQVELSKMVTNDLVIGLALPLSIVERSEFLK